MIKKWLKNKLGISALEDENRELREQLSNHRQYVYDTMNDVKKLTRVDADIAASHRGQNTVILTGVYRNRGYVRFYDFKYEEFEGIVNHLGSMKRHGLIRNIDQPHCFGGSFDFLQDV